MTKILIKTERMYLAVVRTIVLASRIRPRKPTPNMCCYSFPYKSGPPYGVLEFDYDSLCDLADVLSVTD